jgi:phosphate/sulfate permease
MALRMIGQSKVFSPETRAWARYNRDRLDSTPPHLTRELMHQWWRANEARFEAHDYEAVQPGQNLPPYSGPLGETVGVDRPAATAIATPVLPIPTSLPPTSEPITNQVEGAAHSGSARWVAAAIAVALAMGLLFIWKRRV